VPRRPDMRVLYMSGFGNRLATGFGTLSPAVTVLHKPFTPQGLATKVRESLNRSAAQCERA
jgi:DNA-binding response OmpR family regulator